MDNSIRREPVRKRENRVLQRCKKRTVNEMCKDEEMTFSKRVCHNHWNLTIYRSTSNITLAICLPTSPSPTCRHGVSSYSHHVTLLEQLLHVGFVGACHNRSDLLQGKYWGDREGVGGEGGWWEGRSNSLVRDGIETMVWRYVVTVDREGT